MLEHVGRVDLAGRLRLAVHAVVHDGGVRTRDLGGDADTKTLSRAIIERLS
jgi:isocitrate dehydrogenase (NAD+)